jgi:uncharacterized protein YndB with AHSA1/START domain
MTGTFTATASVTVEAPPAEVWKALTDPEIISRYYFGTTVETDWQPGSPITWHGEWEGKPYEDRGTILQVDPGRQLKNTHFSPMSGQPDVQENYHTLTYLLEPEGAGTKVTLTQDNAASEDEASHDADNWRMMLEGLKRVTEGSQ